MGLDREKGEGETWRRRESGDGRYMSAHTESRSTMVNM
jgi:hypothetical protein